MDANFDFQFGGFYPFEFWGPLHPPFFEFWARGLSPVLRPSRGNTTVKPSLEMLSVHVQSKAVEIVMAKVEGVSHHRAEKIYYLSW